MALKLSIIAIAWALAILDVLAPEQFVYKNPLPLGPEEVAAQNAAQVFKLAKTEPEVNTSERLADVVATMEGIARDSGHPVEALSISLMNVTTGDYAGVRDDLQRYPASLIKLFWAIAAIERGYRGPDIHAAIHESDNPASNRLLVQGGFRAMDDYWADAGFDIKASDVVGFGSAQNRLTASDLARLLIDIHSGERDAHRQVFQAMAHPIDAEREVEHGAIKGYLGSGLAGGTIHTKVGWVEDMRGEAALIELGGRTYAIAIIGEDATYANSESLFPAFAGVLAQQLGR